MGHVHQSPPNQVSNMTNESAGISYVVGAPERQGCGFRVQKRSIQQTEHLKDEGKKFVINYL